MPRRSAARQLGSRAAEMPGRRPKILLLLCEGAEAVRKALATRARLDCSDTLAGAKQLWRAGHYDVVLAAFNKDPEASITFCKEIKSESPHQLLIFLAGTGENLSPEPCPDAVFPKEEPAEYLMARIETFLAARSRGYVPGLPGRPSAFFPRA
jgi:hypothetical protein